jgi:WD40 repeat protein
VVSGSSDGRLQWWDIESGACLYDREAHNGAVRALRRIPDGTKLASCGDDGTIKIWDQQNGDCLQVLSHDRPYERLDITGVQGLTEAQLQTLRVLGAVDDVGRSREAQN